MKFTDKWQLAIFMKAIVSLILFIFWNILCVYIFLKINFTIKISYFYLLEFFYFLSIGYKKNYH